MMITRKKPTKLVVMCRGLHCAKLTEAVAEIALEEVKSLLEAGANPNYVRQETVYHDGLPRLRYQRGGTEFPEMIEEQPTTPLKLCVFRYSDCTLDEDDRKRIIEVAKVLVVLAPTPSKECSTIAIGTGTDTKTNSRKP
jgi:hypothetical protein